MIRNKQWRCNGELLFGYELFFITETHKPKGAFLYGQYHYLTDQCGGERINEQIASKFIELMMRTSFGWAGGCYGNPHCKIENVRVRCGQQTRRKRDTVDGKETARVPLSISFTLKVPMPIYSNTSLDLNQTFLQITSNIRNELESWRLNVSGVVIITDPSRPPEVLLARLICGKGQMQSGASCGKENYYFCSAVLKIADFCSLHSCDFWKLTTKSCRRNHAYVSATRKTQSPARRSI